MIVKIAIVGLRSYLRDGETLDDFAKRVPEGTTVYLRRALTNEKFPGTLIVLDDDGKQIGNVSKHDRRRIDLEVEDGKLLPVTISEVCVRHKCLWFKYNNTHGIKDPYIRQVQLMDGETDMSFTEHDHRLISLTQMMRARIDMLKDQTSQDANPVSCNDDNKGKGSRNVNPLLKTCKEYLEYCCTSMDGETTFSRDDILHDMELLTETYPELLPLHEEIFEKQKDLGRIQDDVKTSVYLAQYNRIKDAAERKGADGCSPLDDYGSRLAFRNGGELTVEVIDHEILAIAHELANALERKYVEAMKSDQSFADAIYSLNYSMQGLYRIYIRRIRLEWLRGMKAAMENHGTVTADDATASPSIPPELNTPQAQQLWQKAMEKGWVDEHWQPTISQKKAAVLASVIDEKLDLGRKWKPFETLWGIKELATKFAQAADAKYYSGWMKEIEAAL